MEESKVVTIKEQRAHLRKIKKLTEKFHRMIEHKLLDDGNVLCALSPDEVDTIQRALACHMCVITVDIKSRKERERKALDEIKQAGSKSQGGNHPGEPPGQEETDTAR